MLNTSVHDMSFPADLTDMKSLHPKPAPSRIRTEPGVFYSLICGIAVYSNLVEMFSQMGRGFP